MTRAVCQPFVANVNSMVEGQEGLAFLPAVVEHLPAGGSQQKEWDCRVAFLNAQQLVRAGRASIQVTTAGEDGTGMYGIRVTCRLVE